MICVFGGSKIDLTLAIFVVSEFGTDTSQALFAGDDSVAGWVAPVVVVEGSGTVCQVAKYEGYGVCYIPTEFHSIKIEFREAATVTHGGSPGPVVAAGFGTITATCTIGDIGAVGVGLYRNGEILVHVGGGGKIDILVRRISGIKIAIKIGGVVRIDGSVKFHFGGESKGCSHQGHR